MARQGSGGILASSGAPDIFPHPPKIVLDPRALFWKVSGYRDLFVEGPGGGLFLFAVVSGGLRNSSLTEV